MSFMLKATFRCMKHLWEHSIAKSGLKYLFAVKQDGDRAMVDD